MDCEAEAFPPVSRAPSPTLLPRAPAEDRSAYDRVFWLAYLSNGLTTIANGMLVRYADFVGLIGGEEQQLGLIVGVGMVGSIAMRLVQGVGIDRYGAARIWRGATICFAISLVAHLFLSSAYSPAVFIARAVLQTSLAGIFGASLTFISLRAPPQRMAEMIGTLGTSGFLGLLVGPLLSDWICGGPPVEGVEIQRLFILSAAIASTAALATWLASTGHVPPTSYRRPKLVAMLWRYTPFAVAMVAAAMGAGFVIPFTFLRPFAQDLRIPQVGWYFTVYAVTAFVARMTTRQMFMRFGNRPWILVGMSLLTLSFLSFVPVKHAWQLLVPGAVAGVAHALLFPSTMAAGATVFPPHYRGVATSLMLAMYDIGTLLGAPAVGVFLEAAKNTTDGAYPRMFACTAAVMFLVTLIFFIVPSPHSPSESDPADSEFNE